MIGWVPVQKSRHSTAIWGICQPNFPFCHSNHDAEAIERWRYLCISRFYADTPVASSASQRPRVWYVGPFPHAVEATSTAVGQVSTMLDDICVCLFCSNTGGHGAWGSSSLQVHFSLLAAILLVALGINQRDHILYTCARRHGVAAAWDLPPVVIR